MLPRLERLGGRIIDHVSLRLFDRCHVCVMSTKTYIRQEVDTVYSDNLSIDIILLSTRSRADSVRVINIRKLPQIISLI